MGISRLATDGNYNVETDAFNKISSILNNDLPNISVLNSKNVLFSAQEGFIVYNPDIKYPNDFSFKTYIREVSLTSNSDSTIFAGNFWDSDTIRHSQAADKLIVLPYKNNSVYFEYSSNYMNDFDQTRYQYKLEGFEDDWSSWQQKTSQNYTNLPEGSYVFRARAKNISNLVSEEAVFRLEVLRPWYKSKYAVALYFVVFLGSFVLIFIVIDRRYSKSKKHFEKEKQLEVDQIGNKLKTVTEEKTVEIEKLKSEKLVSEIEFKNAELATSTMNLINKNKFIGHIKENINVVSKKVQSPEAIKELEKISKEIDRNLSHDNDWKQFAFHFNSVHGDFTSRLTAEYEHLSSQDLRLCSFLRLNLSTKEIAQLLNISVRGVEIGRYRLRKKLNLKRNINLSEFILNY
jgi:DNA-binding CsgD family transcriptional regulator